MGTPANVIAGPGLLYVAVYDDVKAAFPTDSTTPLGGSWTALGFTLEGSDFDWNVTREKLYVAESNEPIRSYATRTEGMLKAMLAEATAQNLSIVLNAFDTARTTGAAVAPVDPSAEVAMSFALDTDQGARYIYKKCRNTGTVTLSRKKAPAAVGIPLNADLEVPDDGSPSWVAFPSALDLI